jgi:hypothetical protein
MSQLGLIGLALQRRAAWVQPLLVTILMIERTVVYLCSRGAHSPFQDTAS